MTRLRVTIALLACAFLALGLTVQVFAQDPPKPAGAKPDRVAGNVHMINKDTSIITVRENRTNAMRQVVYNESTKFMNVDKPGALEDVKEGSRVICVGKFDDKARLVATTISVRLPR